MRENAAGMRAGRSKVNSTPVLVGRRCGVKELAVERERGEGGGRGREGR